MTNRVELVGGPADGTMYEVPHDGLKPEIRVAIMAPVNLSELPEGETPIDAKVGYTYGVYRPTLPPTKTTAGAWRYAYSGTELA